MKRAETQLKELQDTAEELMGSSAVSWRTKRRLIRGNYRSVLPFTVNQGELPICAYVTMAKVLLFNVMGLVMDVTLTPEEEDKISALTNLYPIRADTDLVDRYLTDAIITPTTCSPKGFALIVLFFYFFDWLKKHKMKPTYFPGELVEMFNEYHRPYTVKLDKLFVFLKLKTTRLGGLTFSANGWIQEILERVSPNLEMIHWKQISVCTLNTPFGTDIPRFTTHDFVQLCDILFQITKKFKVILTVRGDMGDSVLMHDVMIIGVEGDHLLISNSWGEFIDKVPIDKLPNITLRVKDDTWKCMAFQFIFLLPFLSEIPFELQYYLGNFGDFNDKIHAYFEQMDVLQSLPQLDPAILDKLALRPSAAIGGTRKNKIRYGRSKSRKRPSSKTYNWRS